MDTVTLPKGADSRGPRSPAAADSTAIDLQVHGMTCASCVARVEKALARVPGVTEATVNLANRRAHVALSAGNPAGLDALVAAVEATGYRAGPAPRDAAEEASADRAARAEARRDLVMLGIAAALTLPLVLHMFLPAISGWTGLALTLPAWAQLALATPVQFWIGARFYRAAWPSLRHGSANMDLLVVLGTTAAYGLSLYNMLVADTHGHGEGPHLYFEASAVVITLILLGRTLEDRARAGTSAAIRALMKLRPDTAIIERGGQPQEMPLALVRAGDIALVKPGGRIPVDGTVVEGTSQADESLITGESLPVEKAPGDAVVGGSINGDGLLRIGVTAVGTESTLSRIIAAVEGAQASKAPVQRLVDRISAVFVPAVVVLAALTFLGWWLIGGDATAGILNAVSLLVVACPCALGLATPTALMAGTGMAAKAGILIRDAEALERARGVTTVVFDKTGTLTVGKPAVTGMAVAEEVAEDELLRLAATAQQGSEHPLAHAVLDRAGRLSLGSVVAFQRLGGRGLVAQVELDGAAREIAIGSARLMRERDVDLTPLRDRAARLEEEGRTMIWVAEGKRLLGLLAAGDDPRPDAADAVAALAHLGIGAVMLTGDNARAAHAIAARIGISQVIAEVLPEDKAKEIARLRAAGQVVAMVGDGVNDAPALAAADVGIAMGGGSDVAMETAGITLLRPSPLLVPEAIALSRATTAKIRQNLFWAFVYNLAALPLAAGGLMTPIVAGAAMAASSVSVVTNSLLLTLRRTGARP